MSDRDAEQNGGSSGARAAAISDIHELMRRKEEIEAQIKANYEVLEGVSVGPEPGAWAREAAGRSAAGLPPPGPWAAAAAAGSRSSPAPAESPLCAGRRRGLARFILAATLEVGAARPHLREEVAAALRRPASSPRAGILAEAG